MTTANRINASSSRGAARQRCLCVVTLLLLGLLIWPVPLFSQQKAPRLVDLYAVIVGVKNFQDASIPALSRSDVDARDFFKFLKERASLFRSTHVTVLLNEEATRANVASALRQNLKPAGRDDIVIVYLSGHGATDPVMPNEYYFLTYDSRADNLFGTALLMNDANLFKGVDSKHVLLLSDACHSGGFNTLLDAARAKSAERFLSVFQMLPGRVAISSSRADEKSYEKDIYGNSIFTHFLLKGLRGEAESRTDGVVTAKALYSYVYEKSRDASGGLQNPQMYCAKGTDENTQVFVAPKYADPLHIKAQFFYEADDGSIKPLHDNLVLKSGQHVGVAFRAESDCFVYIYWWDSTGQVGRLFPNPQLTEGSGEVKAGRTYWLPSKDGERWYILDDNPGSETIYFVASRQRNEKLEQLYETIAGMITPTQAAKPAPPVRDDLSLGHKNTNAKAAKQIAENEMQKELSLMGFAARTVPKNVQNVSFGSKEQILDQMENQIRVSGAEAVFKVQFQHVRR
jgi:hypothetical protein